MVERIMGVPEIILSTPTSVLEVRVIANGTLEENATVATFTLPPH